MQACVLCQTPGGEMVWEDSLCRVVLVADGEGIAFPGYCRVIWRAHVAEMTDLDGRSQRHLMNVVMAVEGALRSLVAPDKINLAALGNLVPHLHWHVIPRWHNDSHFPAPIWATAQRNSAVVGRAPPDIKTLAAAISANLSEEEGGA